MNADVKKILNKLTLLGYNLRQLNDWSILVESLNERYKMFLNTNTGKLMDNKFLSINQHMHFIICDEHIGTEPQGNFELLKIKKHLYVSNSPKSITNKYSSLDYHIPNMDSKIIYGVSTDVTEGTNLIINYTGKILKVTDIIKDGRRVAWINEKRHNNKSIYEAHDPSRNKLFTIDSELNIINYYTNR